MSPSPGLAPGPGAVTLRTLHRQIRPQRRPPDNGSGRASHHLAETGNSLWPDHEPILSECKRASCLKPASDCLRTPHCAKKTREPAPSTVLAQILHRLSAPESWASATRRELRLVIDLSIDNAVQPAGRSGRRPCLPSVMPLETCFQKMAGVSLFARGNPSVAGDVRGIRRQTTTSRSIKALVGRCRTLSPRSGTACSRSLQALIHNAGMLPRTSLTGSAESRMRLFRLNLLGMIPLFLELKATSVSIVNVS